MNWNNHSFQEDVNTNIGSQFPIATHKSTSQARAHPRTGDDISFKPTGSEAHVINEVKKQVPKLDEVSTESWDEIFIHFIELAEIEDAPHIPIGSMYGIFTNIYPINDPNQM